MSFQLAVVGQQVPPRAVPLKPGVNLVGRSERVDVQLQGEQLCLWAIVDTDEQRFHKYIVHIEGTGQGPLPFEHRLAFLCRTVQQRGMVWHVFVLQELAKVAP